MELLLAILVAGPIGYFAATRARGLRIYLIAWAVVFPIQTLVVFSEEGAGDWWQYFPLNAAILALGLGLNQCGFKLAKRA